MVLSRTGVASLVLLAAALVLGVVLGFILAFESSKPDLWEERWAELGVPEAEFVFLGNLTGREQESIRRELKVAQVVFAEHFGAVTSDFTVYVSTDLEGLNKRLKEYDGGEIEFTCGGLAPRRAIFLALSECPEADEYGEFLAHEYFHMLQDEAGHRIGSQRWLSDWLREGSAVYAGGLFQEEQGRRTLSALRQVARLEWRSLEGSPTLSPYMVGYLAADWLEARAGPKALLEFFRLGQHRVAFETAFGLSVDSFFDSFERHRQEVAAPYAWVVAGRVVGPDGMPVEGMEVHIGVRIEERLWSAGMTETDSQGEFELSVPGSGYTVGLFARCPGDDGTRKWAHAGQWGAAGFVADADGSYEDEDDRAEPFSDGERDRTGMVIELPETRESVIAKHC